MSETTTAYIVDTLLGIFAVTEDRQIVEAVEYPKNAKMIATIQERLREGEVTRELRLLIEGLQKRGFRKIVVTERSLANAVRKEFDLTVEPQLFSPQIVWVRRNFAQIAQDRELISEPITLLKLSHEISMVSASIEVQKAQSEQSNTITQMVQLLNELDKTLNVLSSKLREWYGLHFPEMNRQVDSHETYARIILEGGNRNRISKELLEGLGIKTRQTSIILRRAKNSMGAPIDSEDMDVIKGLAENMLSLYAYRQKLEEHISQTTSEIAPNLAQVAGPVLAAKLIEKAGSLKKLAMLTSSTVQILGAEKALYRSKKTRARPPKHGLIFQHPYVHSKNRKDRGKAARTLSAKLSIAARADVFSGNPIGAELRRQLDEGDTPPVNQ